MINNRFNSKRTANGGFTLVELLVVIGIIAILAGVALGPITNGIKKAKQSSGMQTAHVLALSMFSFANDHDGTYADESFPLKADGTPYGYTGAKAVVVPLLQGKYVTDASIFFIGGAKGSKFTDAANPTNFTSANSSFDFAGQGDGTGLNTNSPDSMPIIWSNIAGGTQPNLVAANTAMTALPSLVAPYAQDGVAVGYKNNGSKFLIGDDTHTVTMVDKSYPGLAAAKVLVGNTGS